MKTVAIVGFGFMGRTHYGAWKKCRGAKVVAVCVTDLSRLNRKVEGNVKGVADNTRLPKSVRLFDNFENLLAAGGFDIVDITVPTVLHPQLAIAALNAGCHVLCEKPMALSTKDCDRMLATARRAKRELMVAHCVRYFPENRYVGELVRSGRYGTVVAADLTRFIAPPKWSSRGTDWFFDERKSGGVLFDVHIHDADYIAGTFGKPRQVFAVAHRKSNGFIDHTTTTYSYPNAVVTSDSSFAAASSLVWDASGRVFFERATVVFGPLYKTPLTVYPDGGKPFSPRLASATGYEAEVADFLARVEGRRPRVPLTARDARDSVALVMCERASIECGKPVEVR